MKTKNKSSLAKRAAFWLLLLAAVVTSFAAIAIPVWLIRPFSPQTESDLATAFFLKSWSPIFTVLAAIFAVAAAVWLFLNSARWWSRALLVLPLALIVLSVWFARQNHFEWMFAPLANSAYAKTAEADFVKDDEMVLSVKINNDSAAYPVTLMAYHHLVADSVGGVPIVATY